MSVRLVSFVLLVGAVGLWTVGLRHRQVRAQEAADFARIPTQVGARIGVDESFDARTLEVLHANRVLGRIYRHTQDGSRLELFVAYFGSQETGSQIHSPQNCLPGNGWHILGRSKWAAPTRTGPRSINEFVIGKGTQRQLIHYWFVTRSGVLSNEFALKWDLVRNSLLGLPTDAAFVRLARPVGPEGLDASRSDLRQFCGEILPVLDEAIPIAPANAPLARAN
ncbi:MAG TPA: EpsI family protein [Candidatus Dormibacteraeota bacterium]|nr:EpsI family protein [Candidatus Dormibacteraeota bacterium]